MGRLMVLNEFVVVGAVLTAVLGVGRLARLVTYDDYPPTIWLRIQWARLMHDGPWTKLATCFWCLSPWLMLPTMAWFFAGYFWGAGWAWSWWLFYGWLALSYVTSMVVARDEPRD